MNRKPIRLQSKAVDDVETALSYLLQESAEKAALGLISALQKTYTHIQSHPSTGSTRIAHELDLPGLRTWPVHGFPYLVFYVEQDQHIEIWRVLPTHRDIPSFFTTPH